LLRSEIGNGTGLWMGVCSLDRYPTLKVEGSEGYGLAYGYLLVLRVHLASNFDGYHATDCLDRLTAPG